MKSFNRSMLVGMLTLLLLTAGGQGRHAHLRLRSVVKSPNAGSYYNFLLGVAAISASDVWAVGSYLTNPNGPSRTLTEQWDGTRWQVVPSPNVGAGDNTLSAVAASSANDVWAVGGYIDPSSRNYVTLTEFFC